MLVLDDTMVNVALRTLRRDLDPDAFAGAKFGGVAFGVCLLAAAVAIRLIRGLRVRGAHASGPQPPRARRVTEPAAPPARERPPLGRGSVCLALSPSLVP